MEKFFLVVDDDEMVNSSICELLELDDIATKSLYNSIQYKEYISNKNNRDKIECIVMDYYFENDELNGIEMLNWTKENFKEFFQNVKKIFVTGNLNQLDKKEHNFLDINNIVKKEKPVFDILGE